MVYGCSWWWWMCPDVVVVLATAASVDVTDVVV